MEKRFSHPVALLIITQFMIKHDIPEDMIENVLFKFDTTMDHRVWTRDTIELAKKTILEEKVKHDAAKWRLSDVNDY